MNDTIRWGILGTGSIAKKFAQGLSVLPDARLAAVGSRAAGTAATFADEFDIPRRHPDYGALANDPEIDAIYVATPHPFHRENSILCLKAGKAVLCEKPLAINHRQATETVAVAREKGVFLMEAMWTRFLPIIVKVRQWLSDGAIGDLRMVSADFGFRAGFDPESRAFSPALGGGGLLDVGIYTVSFASMVYGEQPTRIAGLADIGETGVDEQAAVVLGYPEGQLALLACAVRTRTPHEALILGTDGSIRIHPPFWQATTAVLSGGGKEETVELPYDGNGYNCEASEVMRCLREGKLESDTMSLNETLAIMETMDRIRAEFDLKYPMEQ